MLDQKPENPPPDPHSDALGEDFVAAPDAPASTDSGSRGGMLGRFRGGVAAPPREPKAAPLWRRIMVFLFKWSAIAAFLFVIFSVAAVFVVGWTGPPPTFNMASRAMAGVEVRREWVALKDVSPHLVRAVIAAEDQDFCAHDGFDYEEIQKALDDAEQGRRVRGASTISQQTVKNVFLYNGGGWVRKGFEAWFTVLVEAMWSKPRILEIYLNVAEWGDGVFGAEQAAKERFKTTAKTLSSRQAALLASVLPNPNRWKVTGAYADRRAGQVQALMGMVRREGLDSCVVK